MRILIADDDLGSRMVAEAAVVALGHDCVLASDGNAAWRQFEDLRPDVLVTDWMMPGFDGLELCRSIRGGSQDHYTYIIVVTSRTASADILAAMEAGADDFVTKPLDSLNLQARLFAAQRVTSLHFQLRQYRNELAVLAHTDPLTQLRNRLTLADDLEMLHAQSSRYGRPYSLALLDVDFFKPYNDTYGHQAGDEALRSVARTLTEQRRRFDRVYRYGGEEFLIVLPEQYPAGALVTVDRVRQAVEKLAIPHLASAAGGVLTISAGIGSYLPPGLVSVEDVLKSADAALYEAKAAGRNTVLPGPDPLSEEARRGVPPTSLA